MKGRLMEIEIREYEKKDWYGLLNISEDEWKTEILNFGYSMIKEYDGQTIKMLLAFSGKVLVGFIYGFVLPNKVLIPEFMYVKPEYRKNGIAHKLLSELEKLSECAASLIFYNKILHGFYQKQGYQAGENLEVALKNL